MSSFGTILKVSTFGESHGLGVGCIIENFPSQFKIDLQKLQVQLNRRRPGQSTVTTCRNEADVPHVYSGIKDNLTLGTPIMIMVRNLDIKPKDYINIPRPGHADFTYLQKYGIATSSGGGRSSARETVARVIAGSLAEQWLLEKFGIEICAWVSSVGEISTMVEPKDRRDVDQNIVRCPEPETSKIMEEYILSLDGDSCGGAISCRVTNVPAGLGEPCFDKLEARLAFCMMSIPSTKGFEIGSGFGSVAMTGKNHNDCYTKDMRTKTNFAGGVLGGISSGEDLKFRIAFKPPSTIKIPQETCDLEGNPVILEYSGRHDPCVVMRAVPIVEAMTALCLMDMILMQQRNIAFK